MVSLMTLPLAGCSPKAKTDQQSGSIDDGAAKCISVTLGVYEGVFTNTLVDIQRMIERNPNDNEVKR